MVKIDPENCTACGTCVEICPVEAITLEEEFAVINQDECTECETCVSECPVEAIKVE